MGRERSRSRDRDSRKRRKESRARSDDSTSSRERFRKRRKGQQQFLAKSQRKHGGLGTDQSMFWDGFQWIPRSVGANSQEHNATRKNRRLYVANLPTQLGLSEEMLGQQMFVQLRDRGLISMDSNNPVLHVWFARDKGGNYGFVEFATLEETEKALTLDGMLVMGIPITIKRPSDYALPIMPASMLASQLPALTNPSDLSSLLSATAPAELKPTSRIVRMIRILQATDQTESDEYLDVIQDMKDGVARFGGPVNKVLMARTDVTDPSSGALALSAGDALLEFPDFERAEQCFKAMKGRKYDSRPVTLASVDEQQWQNLLLPILFEMNGDAEGLGF
jgi:splicing factor U2AF 65 kDa subunit